MFLQLDLGCGLTQLLGSMITYTGTIKLVHHVTSLSYPPKRIVSGWPVDGDSPFPHGKPRFQLISLVMIYIPILYPIKVTFIDPTCFS